MGVLVLRACLFWFFKRASISSIYPVKLLSFVLFDIFVCLRFASFDSFPGELIQTDLILEVLKYGGCDYWDFSNDETSRWLMFDWMIEWLIDWWLMIDVSLSPPVIFIISQYILLVYIVFPPSYLILFIYFLWRVAKIILSGGNTINRTKVTKVNFVHVYPQNPLFLKYGIFGWFFGFFSSLVCRIELILFPLLLHFSADSVWYPNIKFTTPFFFGPIMGKSKK